MLVVTAIHTFVAEHSDELEFSAGEHIQVLEKDDAFGDGWWKGRNTKGEEGLFPATYITEDADSVVPTDSVTPGEEVSATSPPNGVSAAAGSNGVNGQSGAESPKPGSRAGSRSASPVPTPDLLAPAPISTPGTSTTAALAVPAAVAPEISPLPAADSGESPLGGKRSLDIVGGNPSIPPPAPGDDMGSTIGHVQKAIDTMAPDSKADADAIADAEDDDEDEGGLGIGPDARARLALQAKLANEQRERRESTGVADVAYSDESDDDDEHPHAHSHSHAGAAAAGAAGAAVLTGLGVTGARGLRSNGHEPTIPEVEQERISTHEAMTKTPESMDLAPAPEIVPSVPAVPAPVPAADAATLNEDTTPASVKVAMFPSPPLDGAAAASAPASATASSVLDTPEVPSTTALRELQPALPLPATPPLDKASSSKASIKSGKPPSTWTVDEVVQWAQGKGFDETICGRFVEHDISGDVLVELDVNLLKELDIPQFGKRLRLAQAIAELRRPASVVSGSSLQPSSLITDQGPYSRHNFSAPPSAYPTSTSTPPMTTPTSAEDASAHAAWAHGRKVSMTPTTHPIDESLPMTLVAPIVTNGSGSRAASVSVPVSPATPNSSVAKRESTGSLGHKKARPSIDNKDRLSFFGRTRKPPPTASSPGGVADQRSTSRLGFPNNKPASTTMTAATPERRASSGAGVAATVVGGAAGTLGMASALKQIGKPDKTGYMKKRGERYNTWKTRFFVLKGSHLYYLKSETEDRVKGHIDLKGHRIIVDENTNPGSYGFRLVGPGAEKPHYFSSSEQTLIREWMKALMKATIARDYTVPVTSSCNIPTIPLAEAQALQPRPPSPAERDATQRANRRENVNQLTARDASVLMSLDSSGQNRRTSQNLAPAPSRPSRDMRRPSVASRDYDRGRPSVSSFYAVDDGAYGDIIRWVNATLPPPYPKASSMPASFVSGEVIFLLVRHLSKIEPNPPVPPSAFARDADGLPNVEGLFAMMDGVIDAGIDSAGVSLNEIRAGDSVAIARLLESVRAWAREKGVAA